MFLPINLIVFSKDRPMQLQALLDSIRLHAKGFFSEIDVIYLATDSEYQKGYDILSERHPDVVYKKQENFKQDILHFLKYDYVCMAADDDIVFLDINKNSLELLASEPEAACFSLRLGSNINYCYSNNKPNKLGKDYKIRGDFLRWEWRNEELDFAYPLSVVSHIFMTSFIKELTEQLNFINPNTYEGTLQSLTEKAPKYMLSYSHSRIVGVPANSVNSSWTNRNGLEHPYTTVELNTRYLNGEVIDVAEVNPEEIHAAQQEIKYNFKKYELVG